MMEGGRKTYPNDAPGLCDWPCSAPCALPGCAHPRCPGSMRANGKRVVLKLLFKEKLDLTRGAQSILLLERDHRMRSRIVQPHGLRVKEGDFSRTMETRAETRV